MTSLHPTIFLKNVLRLDAATCLLMGFGMTVFSGQLSELFDLPAGLLTWAGLSLFPFAGMLLLAAGRERVPQPLLVAIILLNAGWAIDSFLMGLAGWVTPNTPGAVFLYGQALGTAALATLETAGWKSSQSSGAVLARA